MTLQDPNKPEETKPIETTPSTHVTPTTPAPAAAAAETPQATETKPPEAKKAEEPKKTGYQGPPIREFVYDSRVYPDPDPSMTADEVRQSMTTFFPELSNSDTSTRKDNEKTIVTFTKRTGTKG